MKSQDVEILCSIFALFGKTTPYGKIFKIMFQKFTCQHQSMLLCTNVVKSVKSCVIYCTKKNKFRLPLKLSLLHEFRPKSARANPQHLAHNVPNFIQIGSLSAEL